MALFVLRLADGTLLDVLDGALALPLLGTWAARLTLGEDAAPTEGQRAALLVARDDGAEPDAFEGTLGPCRPHEGRVFVELVGAAGLLGPVVPLHYTAAPTPVAVADLVSDLVAAAGEQLAEGVALAGLSVARWSRLQGESWAAALGRVAERFNLGWRVLASGAVWMGPEAWPTVTAEPFLEWEDTETTTLHVAFDDARWVPGTVVLGKRIVRVRYLASGHAELAYETDEGRLFAELVGRLSRTSPYASTYTAEVISQHEDGSLDLRVVDGPIVDLLRVPFEVGIEGARVLIPAKSMVRVGFEGARPDGAFAAGRWWEKGAQRGIARMGDMVDIGMLVLATSTTAPTAIAVAYTPANGVGAPVAGVLSLGADGQIQIPLKGPIVSASAEAFLR